MPWGNAAVLRGAVGMRHGAVGGVVAHVLAPCANQCFAAALVVLEYVAPGAIGKLLVAADDLVGRFKGSGKLPICRSLASVDLGNASRPWRDWRAWFEGLPIGGNELFSDWGVVDDLGGDMARSTGTGEVSG